MATNDPDPGTPGSLEGVLTALSGIVAAPATDRPGWVREARSVARAAFEAFRGHAAESEAEGGFLPEVTGRKPGLMATRERLAHEHTDMLHRAEEIETEAGRQLAFDDYNVELLRLQLCILRDILQLHILRSDDVLFEAFFRDEGGGD